VILAVVACLTGTSAYAQVRAGLKGGAILANLSQEPEQNDCCDNKTGFAAGAFFSLGIANVIGIQPEVMYVQKGAKSTDGLGDEETLNINYIDIPVLVTLGIPTGTGVRPFFVGGPVFSFKAGTANVESGGNKDESIDDDVSSNDMGIAFGAGLDIGKAIVEFRYNWGLKDVNEDDRDRTRNRGFLILGGFRF
jgi:hypothetical protein